MTDQLLILLTIGLMVVRVLPLRGFWRLPLKNGDAYFLATPVEADFYENRGRALLKQFRTWLLVPYIIDAVAITILLAGSRFVLVGYEQLISILLSVVFYNLLSINFSVKARALATPMEGETTRVSAIQLSLAPRRLRDNTSWPVELTIVGFALVATWAAVQWPGTDGASGASLTPFYDRAFFGIVWLMYLQIGLLLLKRVFVRWRMKLPVSRTEDYKRWRAAWLRYHLRVFDAVRIFAAVGILYVGVSNGLLSRLDSRYSATLVIAAAAITLGSLIIYCSLERRRLSIVEREVRPVELVKEFPPSPIAEGRFLAGGLLYLNRDNPVILARGAHGIALNISHPAIYLWILYFAGMISLMIWRLQS